jgi:ubiquinone/menaquinone biosynthesis C-methylase UbiE
MRTSDAPHDDRGKGHRWFAALYDTLNRPVERKSLGPRREALLKDLGGEVLEIGAGTGANFEHYPKAAHVAAFEPDPFMFRKAQSKLAALDRPNIELRRAPAEQLPVADGSVDAVVSTLVLCTVQDQPGALAEVRRVLRPGGELRFVEHVRAAGIKGRVQDAIKPVWKWVGAGCNPNRRTEQAFREAGFEIVSLTRDKLGVLPLISGVARKA